MGAPIPDPNKRIEEQDPVTLLAMCIFGEARGESFPAKLAVGSVVKNRVGCQGKYGRGFPGVILRPFQFSSFNIDDPNRKKLLNPVAYESEATWAACYSAALATYWGVADDPTQGAVFYHDTSLDKAPAAWGEVVKTTQIDRLVFYREPMA